MFEKLKQLFTPPDAVKMDAQPIELNPPQEKVLSRREARLQRLLTIENPSQEVQDEIAFLTYVGKQNANNV